VLQCAVAGTDGGGRLWWPKPMIEAACVHVWAPHRAVVQTVVLHHHVPISLFKKTIVVMGPANIGRPVATVA
jgi:hypothetical protein